MRQKLIYLTIGMCFFGCSDKLRRITPRDGETISFEFDRNRPSVMIKDASDIVSVTAFDRGNPKIQINYKKIGGEYLLHAYFLEKSVNAEEKVQLYDINVDGIFDVRTKFIKSVQVSLEIFRDNNFYSAVDKNGNVFVGDKRVIFREGKWMPLE